MEKRIGMIQYFWQIIYAHTIAYFVAGVFALLVMNYRDLFATDVISSFMKPVDEPIVVLGPVLQIFRGILLALVLLPLRKVFFIQKNGLMKLGVIILGLSLLSTIGPTMGSFEGYIYTKIPYMYQMLGYPEAILYVLLLHVSIKYAHRRIITLLSILIMALICFLGIMSFVMA